MTQDTAWHPIPGYPSYAASRDGRIWSRVTEREIAQQRNGDGYPSVRIMSENGRCRKSVHRLVAITFLGPCPAGADQVRHLDGSRTNNSAGNLAWGNAAQNAADRETHGRTARGKSHAWALGARQRGQCKLRPQDPEIIRTVYARAKGGLSMKRMGELFGISTTMICSIIHYRKGGHLHERQAALASARGE